MQQGRCERRCRAAPPPPPPRAPSLLGASPRRRSLCIGLQAACCTASTPWQAPRRPRLSEGRAGAQARQPCLPVRPAMPPTHLHGAAGHASRAVAAGALHGVLVGCRDRGRSAGGARTIGWAGMAVHCTKGAMALPWFKAQQHDALRPPPPLPALSVVPQVFQTSRISLPSTRALPLQPAAHSAPCCGTRSTCRPAQGACNLCSCTESRRQLRASSSAAQWCCRQPPPPAAAAASRHCPAD